MATDDPVEAQLLELFDRAMKEGKKGKKPDLDVAERFFIAEALKDEACLRWLAEDHFCNLLADFAKGMAYAHIPQAANKRKRR